MIDRSKVEELIKVLEGTLDELDSHNDDVTSSNLSSKILRGHCDCMTRNMNKIEELSQEIVSSWRKDDYERDCKIKDLATDELLVLSKNI